MSLADLFIAPDANGTPTIWRETGDDYPEALLIRTNATAAVFDTFAEHLEERA